MSNQLRLCNQCGASKPISEFERYSGYTRYQCKTCRGKNVDAQRKYRFGITRAQYQAMLEKQYGKCAACGEGETMLGRSGTVRELSVDHCHESGSIRGLVCDACNNIMGRAKDDATRLRRVAAYLEIASTGHKVSVLSRANIRETKSLDGIAALIKTLPKDKVNQIINELSGAAAQGG